MNGSLQIYKEKLHDEPLLFENVIAVVCTQHVLEYPF